MDSGFALAVFDAHGTEHFRNHAFVERLSQHAGEALEPMVKQAVSDALVQGVVAQRDAIRITADDVLYLIRFVALPGGLITVEPSFAIGLVRQSGMPMTEANLAARYGLTRREAQVARLLARGYSNKAVAVELDLSPYTARNHTRAVMARLGVSSRAKAASLLNSDFGPGVG